MLRALVARVASSPRSNRRTVPVKSCSASTPAADACAPSATGGAHRRDGRFRALIRLLGDESPFVWERVRVELAHEGRRARAALRRESGSNDPRSRSRARTLLAELERRAVVRRLCGYASRDAIDLERALFLLARYFSPTLDPRPFQQALDAYAAELLERGRNVRHDVERARLLPKYLGEELGFGGTRGEFHNPDNIHLHRVLERRAGMPLSLCSIYLFVARRIGVRAGILPLPGHVMLRVAGVILDPYDKGHERTERQCRQYVEDNRLPFHPNMLREASDRSMFKRQLQNLARSAERRGLRREAEDLALVLHALDPKATASRTARGSGPSRGRRA
jgi:regulator of sirC expression with transglutaminase-like and TPR domain